MKKLKISLFILLTSLFLASCGGKPSAEKVAKKYCGMIEEFLKEKDESKQEKIREKMKKYEDSIKEKYGEDDKFMDDIKTKIDECAGKLEDQYGG